MVDRAIPKTVTLYAENIQVLDKSRQKHKVNSSEFVRWAIDNKMSEYINEIQKPKNKFREEKK